VADSHRVLIMSVSAGTGHLRAADAVAKVCRANPRIAEVVNIDCLTYTNQLFRRFYSKFYIQLVRSAPTLLGWFYENTDEPWRTDRMRLMLSRLNTRPLVRMIRRLNPDVTVCTHFLPAEIISYLVSKHLIQTRLAIVVTDFDVHAMWLSRVFHRYFVAIDEAKVHLTMTGMPADRISVSGIPIDPAFAEPKDPRQLREKHGLGLDRPVVLVSAGALGVSAAADIVRVLGNMRSAAQVVVVCGWNRELQDQVAREARKIPRTDLSFHVMGYTSEMDEWMRMADLFIGKPGGLTTAETLACGLPILIVQPIPGQEERNSDHLLEKGVAVKCNQLTVMAHKVDALLEHPAKLLRMRRAARHLAHPNAAQTVVETLLDTFHMPPVELPGRPGAEG
jgi:processive 1,2-diacylglycerol beta-glucosyltransferase